MLKSLLVFLVGVLVGANLVYFAMTREGGARDAGSVAPPDVAVVAPRTAASGSTRTVPATAVPATTATAPAPTPAPVASAPATAAALPASAGGAAPDLQLAIPVAGIAAGQLRDTFHELRGGTRPHEALDIMAPAGTPVLAVADGHVEKLFTSVPGGLTLYQFDPSGRYAYYYAHLQGYAPGLAEGQAVKRGEVIAYVGSTGNANPAAPHLHFAVFALGPERQWWKGTPLNPYPLLGGRAAGVARVP